MPVGGWQSYGRFPVKLREKAYAPRRLPHVQAGCTLAAAHNDHANRWSALAKLVTVLARAISAGRPGWRLHCQLGVGLAQGAVKLRIEGIVG